MKITRKETDIDFNNQKSVNIILIIFLMLFAIDFNLQGIYLFYIGFLILLITKIKSTIKINTDFWILYIFAITYFAFSSVNSSVNIGNSLIGVGSLIAYFWGLNMYQDSKLESIKKVIYILAVFMTFHGLLNFLYNIQLFGFANSIGLHRSYDFWSGELSSATGQATKFTMLASVLFFGMYLEEKVKIRVFFVCIFVMAILYNFQLGGRSFIILSILSIICSIIIVILYSKRVSNIIKTLMPIFIISMLGVIIGFFLFQYNIGNIQSTIESSYLYHRFLSESGQSLTEDSRLDRKWFYITSIFTYPWGGQEISLSLNTGYAHELWLDIFDTAGIIPFICIVLYTVLAALRCAKLLRMEFVAVYYKVLIGTFYIVMFLQFFLEPIVAGSPKLLLAFCLIDGMLSSYLYSKKRIIH